MGTIEVSLLRRWELGYTRSTLVSAWVSGCAVETVWAHPAAQQDAQSQTRALCPLAGSGDTGYLLVDIERMSVIERLIELLYEPRLSPLSLVPMTIWYDCCPFHNLCLGQR